MSDQEKVTLSPADAAAVDAILDRDSAGISPAPVEPERKARAEAWLKVAGSAPAPVAPADLMARTLASIQTAPIPFPKDAREKEVGSYAPAGRWRRKFAEFGAMAVAAALLLLVTLQGMGQVKKSQARVACATNLQKLVISFSDYAEFADGELPMLAMPANRNWLHGGDKLAARNNTANLIPLVNHNFAPMSAFYCPGAAEKAPPFGTALINELPPVSYSYRNLYGTPAVSWDGKHETMIVADKNPLVVDGPAAMPGTEQKGSANHDGRGTYVLRADGSVTWEISPNIGPGGDNIWTLGSGKDRLLSYTGAEYPTTLNDVFFAP